MVSHAEERELAVLLGNRPTSGFQFTASGTLGYYRSKIPSRQNMPDASPRPHAAFRFTPNASDVYAKLEQRAQSDETFWKTYHNHNDNDDNDNNNKYEDVLQIDAKQYAYMEKVQLGKEKQLKSVNVQDSNDIYSITSIMRQMHDKVLHVDERSGWHVHHDTQSEKHTNTQKTQYDSKIEQLEQELRQIQIANSQHLQTTNQKKLVESLNLPIHESNFQYHLQKFHERIQHGDANSKELESQLEQLMSYHRKLLKKVENQYYASVRDSTLELPVENDVLDKEDLSISNGNINHENSSSESSVDEELESTMQTSLRFINRREPHHQKKKNHSNKDIRHVQEDYENLNSMSAHRGHERSSQRFHSELELAESEIARKLKLLQERIQLLDDTSVFEIEQGNEADRFEPQHSVSEPSADVVRELNALSTSNLHSSPMTSENESKISDNGNHENYASDFVDDESPKYHSNIETADNLVQYEDSLPMYPKDSKLNYKLRSMPQKRVYSLDDLHANRRRLKSQSCLRERQFEGSSFSKSTISQRSRSESPVPKKLTVPKPFSFDGRKTNHISDAKFKRYMEELRAREEAELNVTFRANPLPASTLLPRYEEMQRLQNIRNNQIKDRSRQRLLELLRPFGFDYSHELADRYRNYDNRNQKRNKQLLKRDNIQKDSVRTTVAFGKTINLTLDEQRKLQQEEAQQERNARGSGEHRVFVAREAPATSKILMLESNRLQRKTERAKRISCRAKHLRQTGAMLPRMLAWHNQHMATSSPMKTGDENICSIKSHEVPNFKRLHKEFEEKLNSVKQNVSLTRPQSPKLTKKKPKKVMENKFPQFRAKPFVPPPPNTQYWSKSTKKMDHMVAINKARLEKRDRLEEDARKDAELRAKLAIMHKQIYGPVLRAKAPPIEAPSVRRTMRDQELIKRKRELQQAEAEWLAKVEDMKNKARIERPLLMESSNSALHRTEARKKALLEIKASLQLSGVTDLKKIFAKEFDQQELEDLDITL